MNRFNSEGLEKVADDIIENPSKYKVNIGKVSGNSIEIEELVEPYSTNSILYHKDMNARNEDLVTLARLMEERQEEKN